MLTTGVQVLQWTVKPLIFMNKQGRCNQFRIEWQGSPHTSVDKGNFKYFTREKEL